MPLERWLWVLFKQAMATPRHNFQHCNLPCLRKTWKRCQLWILVAWYANQNPADRDVEAYERLAQKDLESGLMEPETIQFKSAVERIMRKILLRSSTRIVTTTLNASATDILRFGFYPDTLVCNESGQCLEAEHVIAMTMVTPRQTFPRARIALMTTGRQVTADILSVSCWSRSSTNLLHWNIARNPSPLLRSQKGEAHIQVLLHKNIARSFSMHTRFHRK